jgi:hypothetical protein
MAGLPILSSDLPELRLLINSYNVGVLAEEINSMGLASALKKITAIDYDMLMRSIEKTKRIFSWEEQEKVLIRDYQELGLQIT